MELERLAPILDALEDAVSMRGARDRLVFANRAALERMGFDSREQLAAADLRAGGAARDPGLGDRRVLLLGRSGE